MAAAVAVEQKTAKRAMQERPAIRGSGMRQLVDGGPTVRAFWVASQSQPGMEHTVFLYGDGRLSCDCPSSHFRGYCAHREAVTKALAEEAQAIQRASARAEEESHRGWVLTEKGRAALEAWRKEQAAAAARETAIPTMRVVPRQSSRRQVRVAVTDQVGQDVNAPLLRPSHGNKPFSLLKQ